jgi:hypothetical protein
VRSAGGAAAVAGHSNSASIAGSSVSAALRARSARPCRPRSRSRSTPSRRARYLHDGLQFLHVVQRDQMARREELLAADPDGGGERDQRKGHIRDLQFEIA